MRLIITFLMAWCLSWGAYAATAPDSKQITQELEQAKAAKPAQPEVVEALQSALNALEERKGSLERIKQYQQVIDNYPKLSATLRAQLNNMRDEPRSVSPGMSTDALNQEILQVSSQLLDKSRQAQQEQERAREIADSLNQLPQQQTDARRQLNEIERRLGTLTGNTPLNQAQNFALQSDSARLKALVDELELAQLSANNRQELARLRSELAEKESKYLRLAAEYDNFRKRSQKEKESAYADAKTDAVSAFLPVYDNLERALKQETCDEAYAKGVEMTMTGLKEIMTRLGIEEIPALGQPFDPNLENAVLQGDSNEGEPGTVCAVLQKGYQMGEAVLRHAMVKVVAEQ